MLRLVRQRDIEFNTLPFAGFRRGKGVFIMLLREARDGILFDCECRHLAKGSIRNYRAETKFLMEFLELKQITEVEDVKAHHIRDFMKQKQDSGNTACYVNDILKACKTWFNYLVNEGYPPHGKWRAMSKIRRYSNRFSAFLPLIDTGWENIRFISWRFRVKSECT